MSAGSNQTPSGAPQSVAPSSVDLRFVDLGRIGYSEAMALQDRTHAAVMAGAEPATVYLLEHDPVITRTRRAADGPHLLANAEALAADGIELASTNRGGDITYHGPGQLVVYPIVPLGPLGINVRQYVCALEGAVIDVLGEFGVVGVRDEAGVGVWVGEAKVAAIGVRVRRWVTLHGFALNVSTKLEHFGHIVPCGLTRPVTSLAVLLGTACPSMGRVKAAAERALRGRLGLGGGTTCETRGGGVGGSGAR